MNKTYYEILGVSTDADTKTIKKAYRDLIKKYHPDINKEPGSEEKFKQIQTAYETLSDEEKKAKYDQLGHEAYTNRQQGGFDYTKYQQGFNAQVIKMGDMKWYQKILMVLFLIMIVLFVAIITVIGWVINQIIMLFRK